MSNPHEFSRCGRYAVTFSALNEAVELIDLKKNIRVRWDVVDLDLCEAIELVENEQGEVGPLSPDEILFLLNYAAGIEQNRELGAHDLYKFGEVGVSG